MRVTTAVEGGAGTSRAPHGQARVRVGRGVCGMPCCAHTAAAVHMAAAAGARRAQDARGQALAVDRGRARRGARARALARRASAAATLAVCVSLLQPRGASSANPNYEPRIVKTSGPLGLEERGIDLGDGRFWPGTSGSEWTHPNPEDVKRIQHGTGTACACWIHTPERVLPTRPHCVALVRRAPRRVRRQ